MPAPQTATTCSTPIFLVAHDFRISSRDVEIVASAIPTDSSFVKMRLSGWFACRSGLLQAHPLKDKPEETASELPNFYSAQ